MDFFKSSIKQKVNCPACVQHQVEVKLDEEIKHCQSRMSLKDKSYPLAKSFVLDVRELDEFLEGSLAGAVNWPLSQLRLDPTELELPTDKEILVCCRSGVRSQAAIEILKLVQVRKYKNLEGGLNS